MGKVIVVVQFMNASSGRYSDKTYEYFARTDGTLEELQKFKFAVVDSPSDRYVVTRVVEIRPLIEQDHDGNLKPVVVMFSDEDYVAELQRKKKLANLERMLEEELAKQTKLDKLKSLAEKNADFKDLLAEYENLMK